jgi:hypothetical protein
LKKNVQYLFTRLDGLRVYLFKYLWNELAVGVMADEVAIHRPDALGPKVLGFSTVNYGVLNGR